MLSLVTIHKHVLIYYKIKSSFNILKGITALLQSCPYLQIILLRKCTAIDDKCLFEIVKTCGVRLTHLNVSGCPLVTDEGLKYLGDYCKNLKAVDLKGTQVIKPSNKRILINDFF
jgi:hypothetical protein